MIRYRIAAATMVAATALVAVVGQANSATRSARKAATCTNAGLRPRTANLSTVRTAVLCLLNAERAKQGLGALSLNGELSKAATGYAEEMVDGRFFAHVSPCGSTMLARIKQTAYLARSAGGWALGENLAYGGGPYASPDDRVGAWMRSAEHRRNILDPRFTEVGVGVAYGTPSGQRQGATYVLDFGTRSTRR